MEEVTKRQGLKNTLETLHGAQILSLFFFERLKDGVGFDDALALFDKLKNDPEFLEVLKRAADGITEVPNELASMDAHEGVELAMVLLTYANKYIEVLKKK